MKHTLTILFFIILTTGTFAKGGAGIYYITGIAYGTDHTILKNTDLRVKIGSVIKTVRTDDNGLYEIEVYWETACPSGVSKKKWERETARLNPKYIYIKYKATEIKIQNDWDKYAELFPESKEKVTRKENFHFT